MPRAPSPDVLQGTLDLLVLKTVAVEPMHGWGIAQRIQERSEEALDVGQGSLYPALMRLERRGWIAGSWGTTENNRRARYYRLTRPGRAQLAEEKRNWYRLTSAMNWMLESEG